MCVEPGPDDLVVKRPPQLSQGYRTEATNPLLKYVDCRSPSSTLSAEHHGKCTLIGTRRGPGGQHRQATSWTRARRSPRSSRTSCSSSTWPSEDVLRAKMIVASTAELRRGQYTCRQGWHRRQTSRAVSAYVPPQRTERHVLAQGCSCESER